MFFSLPFFYSLLFYLFIFSEYNNTHLYIIIKPSQTHSTMLTRVWMLGPDDSIRLRGKGNCPHKWKVVGNAPYSSPERVRYYMTRVKKTAYTTEWNRAADGSMEPHQVPFEYYTIEQRAAVIDDAPKVQLSLQLGRATKTLIVPANAPFQVV